MSYTTVLVAFCVQATDREAAMDQVMGFLPREARDPEIWEQAGLDCWWIAEDDRTDGSDNDSAVFVPMGRQAHWSFKIGEADGYEGRGVTPLDVAKEMDRLDRVIRILAESGADEGQRIAYSNMSEEVAYSRKRLLG